MARRVPAMPVWVVMVAAVASLGMRGSRFASELVIYKGDVYALESGPIRAKYTPVVRNGWRASAGGRTWTIASIPESAALHQTFTEGVIQSSDGSVRYRVTEPARIERSTDGGLSWKVDWELDEDRRYLIARDDSEYVRIRDVLLAPDGVSLFVALGMEGVAIRTPEGDWIRPADGPWWVHAERTLSPQAIAREVRFVLIVVSLLLLLLSAKLRDNAQLDGRRHPLQDVNILSGIAVVLVILVTPFALVAIGVYALAALTDTSGELGSFAIVAVPVALLLSWDATAQWGARREPSVMASGWRRRLVAWALLPVFAWILVMGLTDPLLAYAPLMLSAAVLWWLRKSEETWQFAEPRQLLARAIVVLPLAGMVPFFLWSSGIIGQYRIAAILSIVAVVLYSVKAWREAQTAGLPSEIEWRRVGATSGPRSA